MSKKMKGIAFEDVKAKLKHQTLLQDYQDLQKEVFDMRNRLEAAKGSKSILLAEVRFLRRRYTYLLETKSLKQRQEQSREMGLQNKLLSKGGKRSRKKEANQFKLPPLPDLKHKGRVYAGKEGALRNATNVLGLNRNNLASSCMKEASLKKIYRKRRLPGGDDACAVQSNEPAIYSSQNGNAYGGISNGLRVGIPVFDLNQDTSLVRKEAELPKQAPTFDLNEISMDEEVDYEDIKFAESRTVPLVLQMMNNPAI